MLITNEYLELQKELHKRYDYGKGVDAELCATLLNNFRQSCIIQPGASVLDYGCGQGHLGQMLRHDYDVREYDPCIEGKDTLPEAADVVVCADVLEHIEPECLDDVLEHIAGLTGQLAILVIATGRSSKIMADGREAHLIVENADWWRERLLKYFELKQFQDRSVIGKGVLAIVEAKG